jgi:hypothetical protein
VNIELLAADEGGPHKDRVEVALLVLLLKGVPALEDLR